MPEIVQKTAVSSSYMKTMSSRISDQRMKGI